MRTKDRYSKSGYLRRNKAEMTGKHLFSDEILKSCDIRGVVGENLGSTDAYHVGRSFGTILRERGKKNCAVGRDGRLSSDSLFSETARGLTDSGIRVLNLGLVPTPLVYFAVGQGSADAGIMITASHNPAEYNGFKFLTDEGPFHEEDIFQLSAISQSGIYISGEEEIVPSDLVSVYQEYIYSFLDAQGMDRLKDKTVIWDPGNGATGAVLYGFFEKHSRKTYRYLRRCGRHFPGSSSRSQSPGKYETPD